MTLENAKTRYRPLHKCATRGQLVHLTWNYYVILLTISNYWHINATIMDLFDMHLFVYLYLFIYHYQLSFYFSLCVSLSEVFNKLTQHNFIFTHGEVRVCTICDIHTIHLFFFFQKILLFRASMTAICKLNNASFDIYSVRKAALSFEF